MDLDDAVEVRGAPPDAEAVHRGALDPRERLDARLGVDLVQFVALAGDETIVAARCRPALERRGELVPHPAAPAVRGAQRQQSPAGDRERLRELALAAARELFLRRQLEHDARDAIERFVDPRHHLDADERRGRRAQREHRLAEL